MADVDRGPQMAAAEVSADPIVSGAGSSKGIGGPRAPPTSACAGAGAGAAPPKVLSRLFPAGLLHASWQEFAAEGFEQPVPGVVFRGEPRPTCGLPLGGLDTGCLDVEPNGSFGFSTIFNQLVHPRHQMNCPFLGVSMGGQTTLLASDTKGKHFAPRDPVTMAPSAGGGDYTPGYFQMPGLEGVATVDAIDYWGHYPVVDMEYLAEGLPVSLGLRAFTPFVPGDTVASMVPAAVFEVIVRNPAAAVAEGTVAFSFPGFPTDVGAAPPARKRLHGGTAGLDGVYVHAAGGPAGDPKHGEFWDMGYVLALAGHAAAAVGGPLGTDAASWRGIGAGCPPPAAGEAGAAVTAAFRVPAGGEQRLRFVLAWHAPHWRAAGGPTAGGPTDNVYTHMYTRHYPNALATAQYLAAHADATLARVLRWQSIVYGDPALPGWLADQLVNCLHLGTECSIWAQTGPRTPWASPADGVFALNECPRGCPQLECLPCSFYGNVPLNYFFPETILSTLRGYKAYQLPNGQPPWVFGGCTAADAANTGTYDVATPDPGGDNQEMLNGACVIAMTDRLWRLSGGGRAWLGEFWESLKRCNDWNLNLRPAYGLSQVLAMPAGDAGTEWFEAPQPGWKGYCTHAGGIRLAQVGMMRRMAMAMDDAAYAAKCEAWLSAGGAALEAHLWNAPAKSYYNFNEPETKTTSEYVFGYQLDGQWMADFHGNPPVFPRPRAAVTLDTIRRVNCALSQSGAVNYASPAGAPVACGGYGTFSYFPPELYMLAMTYIYAGQKEFGMQLLKTSLDNQVLKWGYGWDGPNIYRGDADTGQRTYGADYYQNMMLWAMPAALAGQDITGPAAAGGLVHKILAAAASSRIPLPAAAAAAHLGPEVDGEPAAVSYKVWCRGEWRRLELRGFGLQALGRAVAALLGVEAAAVAFVSAADEGTVARVGTDEAVRALAVPVNGRPTVHVRAVLNEC